MQSTTPAPMGRRTFKPCEEAGRATVEDGVVLLDGPDGVAVAMTPESARATAQNLLRAADEAGKAAGIPLPGEPT